jgi:hypothetical protein
VTPPDVDVVSHDNVPDEPAVAVDPAHAAALGIPIAVGADASCACVQVDWSVDGVLHRLDLRRGAVSGLTHHRGQGAADDALLAVIDGESLTLEIGPCTFVGAAGTSIASALGVPLLTVDAGGAPTTCPNRFPSLPERKFAYGPTVVPAIPRVTATQRGETADEALLDALRVLGPRIGHCQREADGAADVLVVRLGLSETGRVTRFHPDNGGLGADADACVADALDDLAVPSVSAGRYDVQWSFDAAAPR